jgi:AcrR family transcriptional regulator
LATAFADGEGTRRRKDRHDVPTGVAIRDPRGQLFAAAERVLLRDGPAALTSRAVTDEAGVAKGVLHRHFADFDDFLAGLVHDRAARIEMDSAALLGAVGTGTVAGNLAEALASALSPVAMAMVALITFRDELRRRLRESWPTGVPLLTEISDTVRAYLLRERDLGRIAGEASTDALALALLGSSHLLFADRAGGAPAPGAVRALVEGVLGGVLR